ncbi:hypothetical protein D3C81_924200 [compost metagenome]
MKPKKLMLIFFSFVIIVIFSFFLFSELKEWQLKKDVKKYLIEEGIDENRVLKIETVIAKAPVLSARVIFADEPNVTYYYRRSSGEIVQFGMPTYNVPGDTSYEFKHMDPRLKSN